MSKHELWVRLDPSYKNKSNSVLFIRRTTSMSRRQLRAFKTGLYVRQWLTPEQYVAVRCHGITYDIINLSLSGELMPEAKKGAAEAPTQQNSEGFFKTLVALVASIPKELKDSALWLFKDTKRIVSVTFLLIVLFVLVVVARNDNVNTQYEKIREEILEGMAVPALVEEPVPAAVEPEPVPETGPQVCVVKNGEITSCTDL